jgi:hypothetical protein
MRGGVVEPHGEMEVVMGSRDLADVEVDRPAAEEPMLDRGVLQQLSHRASAASCCVARSSMQRILLALGKLLRG